jgi:16S rRNA (cytosine1402-N4)-methyltransferase
MNTPTKAFPLPTNATPPAGVLSALLAFPSDVQEQIDEVNAADITPSAHFADQFLFHMVRAAAPTKTAPRKKIMSAHEPVMLDEVKNALHPRVGSQILDGTLGGGGHTRYLLEEGAEITAFDRDKSALTRVENQLQRFHDRLTLHHGNFADARRILGPEYERQFDGILLDLGISSIQLDDPERGFTFQEDGPLDMRMNQESDGPTAADLVMSLPQEELEQIFRKYGEEPMARRVAQMIVRERDRLAFVTTRDLAEEVEKIIPRRGRRHPATRIFQALRIAVNEELQSIERALPEMTRLLKPGGRIAVITFHSLEDRLVKRFFHHQGREWLDRPEWPEPRRNPDYNYRLLSRKSIKPTEEEIARNPRARSAQLRVAERVVPTK